MKQILKVMQVNPETGEPEFKGKKLVYAAADFGKPCSKWVRKTTHLKKIVDLPVQSSGLKFREKGSGKNQQGSLGYMNNRSNDIQNNTQSVGFFGVVFSDAHGLHLFPDNFLRAMTLFAARKCIVGDWINDKDEYVAPAPIVEASEEYEAFTIDALIYALFHGANNCTAIRGVPFKGATVDVANQMFWRTPDEMRKMADEVHYSAMYNDLRGVTAVPHVAKLLQAIDMSKASKEARRVLKYANIFLEMSMKDRAIYSIANPDYHLDSWDAGYYQLKYLWRESRHYDKFRELFKALEATLIPRVYSLGFLRTYEGMGMQIYEAVEEAVALDESVKAGAAIVELDMSPSGKKSREECDRCSVCGGQAGGCDFCGHLGSREYYLDKVFWDAFYALQEKEIAREGEKWCENNSKEEL